VYPRPTPSSSPTPIPSPTLNQVRSSANSALTVGSWSADKLGSILSYLEESERILTLSLSLTLTLALTLKPTQVPILTATLS